MKPKSSLRQFAGGFLITAGMVFPAVEPANGLYFQPPAGWQRNQEGSNVVYRQAECTLTVLPPREMEGQRPVPFFLQTWSSVKGALPILSEQPVAPIRTADGSFARYASVVADFAPEERIIALFMAADDQQAHLVVFTGPQPPCDQHQGAVERALRTVTLNPNVPVPERL